MVPSLSSQAVEERHSASVSISGSEIHAPLGMQYAQVNAPSQVSKLQIEALLARQSEKVDSMGTTRK